jgi:hypothetical protein
MYNPEAVLAQVSSHAVLIVMPAPFVYRLPEPAANLESTSRAPVNPELEHRMGAL